MSSATPSEIARINDCLAYLDAHPAEASLHAEWVREVQSEARKLGLLPPLKPAIGCACRPGIDKGITYGADYIDAL